MRGLTEDMQADTRRKNYALMTCGAASPSLGPSSDIQRAMRGAHHTAGRNGATNLCESEGAACQGNKFASLNSHSLPTVYGLDEELAVVE